VSATNDLDATTVVPVATRARRPAGCRCLPSIELQDLQLAAAVIDEDTVVRACNPPFADLIGCGVRPPGACSDRTLSELLPALACQLPQLMHVSRETARAFAVREVLLSQGDEPGSFAAYLTPLKTPAVSAPDAAVAWRANWMLVLANITPLRAADQARREHLAMEVVLSRIATRLIANEDPKSAIEASLADIGQFTQADGTALGLLSRDSEILTAVHIWRRDGQPSPLSALCGGEIPAWWRRTLGARQTIDIPDLRMLPADGLQELHVLGVETEGAATFASLKVAGRFAGTLIVYHAEPRAEPASGNTMIIEAFCHLLERLIHLQWNDEALQQSAKDLQEKQVQLVQSEKMATIGQMAAGVAHEINNPIGFVMGNLSTLQSYASSLKTLLEMSGELEGILPDLPSGLRTRLASLDREELAFIAEDLDNLLAESLEGCVRVRDIVHNLKGFARLDDKTAQPIDLNACVEATLKIVWNELKYRCEVVTDFGELPPVVCRVGEINQVIMNLLVNAAQAIADRGTISITTRGVGDTVTLAIADTGCGIAPENLPRVFDPFFTTKPAGKGTGLGLNICHNIIEQHRGRIEVASTVGEGTTFTVQLPVGEMPDIEEDIIG
jgi:signal transduction histidine kinase